MPVKLVLWDKKCEEEVNCKVLQIDIKYKKLNII